MNESLSIPDKLIVSQPEDFLSEEDKGHGLFTKNGNSINYDFAYKKLGELFKGLVKSNPDYDTCSNNYTFFNDIVTSIDGKYSAPHTQSGFHLVLHEVDINGKKYNIYHTDINNKGEIVSKVKLSRVFIQEIEE